jgi:hypothetical protein
LRNGGKSAKKNRIPYSADAAQTNPELHALQPKENGDFLTKIKLYFMHRPRIRLLSVPPAQEKTMHRIVFFISFAVLLLGAGLLVSDSMFSWMPARPKYGRPAHAALPELRDDEDPASVLQKAITAHGGAEKLAQFRTVRSQYQGIIVIKNFHCSISGDDVQQYPDKFKQSHRIVNPRGVFFDVISGFDGVKFWVYAERKLTEFNDPRAVAAVRQGMLHDPCALNEFLNVPYELANTGVVDVRGSKAIALRATKTGDNDFLLFIGKKTHLLVKTQGTSFNADLNRTTRQERFITDYMDVAGAKMSKRIEDYEDSRLSIDVEATSITLLNRLDDAIFSQP